MPNNLPTWWLLWMGLIFVLMFINLYNKIIKPAIIQSEVKKLGFNLTNEGVRNYIRFIQTTRIPNQPKAWNACRSSYQLVNSEQSISQDLKDDLKRALLSSGVTNIW